MNHVVPERVRSIARGGSEFISGEPGWRLPGETDTLWLRRVFEGAEQWLCGSVW